MSSTKAERAAITAYPMETDIDKSMQIMSARIFFEQGYKKSEADLLQFIEQLREQDQILNLAAQCGFQIALDKVEAFIKEVVL